MKKTYIAVYILFSIFFLFIVRGCLGFGNTSYINVSDKTEPISVKEFDYWDGGANPEISAEMGGDGFDLSLMPATGTPEPGGLFWDETIKIIKIASQFSHIVGGDINELSPIKGFDSYNFLVAKLAYKIISYAFEFKKNLNRN